MSDDVVRLSELVSEYSRYYGTDQKEAAHAFKELIDGVWSCRGQGGVYEMPLDKVFWVARPEATEENARSYRFHFEALSQYFQGFFSPASELSPSCIICYSELDKKFKEVPANVVRVSLGNLSKMAMDARIHPPEFISKGSVIGRSLVDSGGSALKTLELESIRKIMVGMVQLIREVDRAYTVQPVNYDEKRRFDSIKLHASRLNNPTRKNMDMYRELIEFAEDAGLEFVKDRQTLRGYMHGYSKTGSED